MKLVGILNTKTNKVIPEDDAIMKIMPQNLTTFEDAITYLIKEENSPLADTIQQYLQETDADKPFDIEVYDQNGELKPSISTDRSYTMRLNEEFDFYVDERELIIQGEQEQYKCLDMVVDLNTKVGQ